MSYRRSDQYPEQPRHRNQPRPASGWKLRLILAAVIILFSAVSYYSSTSVNPITQEHQRVGGISPEQEIEIGLSAAFEMANQHGGASADTQAARRVEMMGKRIENALYHKLAQQGINLPYRFDFHLLADNQVINAFALPGGQVFITEALYRRLSHDGQLAGILGHEIGHVIERHGVERLAQSKFYQNLAGAAGVAGGDMSSAQVAGALLQTLSLGYGRQAELESDRWGVELMALIGYHPAHMLDVMEILKDASPGGAPPEFLSSHPKPENRQKYIREVIEHKFPNGLPPGLK